MNYCRFLSYLNDRTKETTKNYEKDINEQKEKDNIKQKEKNKENYYL